MNILDKNIRIGSEYQYNATQTNSVVSFKDSDLIKTNQLAATIYYYNAIRELQLQNNDEAYKLMSKACYLYADEVFINSLYAILSTRLQGCTFDKVEDVDLLGQLSKFKNNNFEYIKNTFWSIMDKRVSNRNNNFGFQTDLAFCTAAYNRLLPQINDIMLANEISFTYNLGIAYCPIQGEINLRPSLQALKLKPGNKPALNILESNLRYLSEIIDNKVALVDTLDHYEVELRDLGSNDLLKNIRIFLFLDIAQKAFSKNKINEGLKYITRFESAFQSTLPEERYKVKLENTYYEYAMYYVRIKNKVMAQKVVNKGLAYVPKSNMIESATYEMPKNKPIILKKFMKKSEYEKYMKKGVID
ncbi:MAG: hypothetical protein WCG93_06700 [Paludibacter sp.]